MSAPDWCRTNARERCDFALNYRKRQRGRFNGSSSVTPRSHKTDCELEALPNGISVNVSAAGLRQGKAALECKRRGRPIRNSYDSLWLGVPQVGGRVLSGRPTRRTRSSKRGLDRNASMLGSM